MTKAPGEVIPEATLEVHQDVIAAGVHDPATAEVLDAVGVLTGEAAWARTTEIEVIVAVLREHVIVLHQAC